MKYNILLFDIDNTLLDFKKDQKFALYSAMDSIGIKCTQELYEDYCNINNKMWQLLNKNQITLSELLIKRFEIFLKNNKINENPEKFRKLVSHGFEKSGSPIKRSRPIIKTAM